jgi:eukaryotic-like serine/threonine-protein kinase
MERLGRYQIEAELGRGSMSIVYEALDPHISRRLAVKVLRERYARDVRSRQRFLREARSAGGLNHPNIVTVFDVGQSEGLPYLVMERLQGENLENYLEAGKSPTPRQVIEIGIQLAGALNYAHERGVVHRDIKPSNIYLDQETGLVKLVDFGIAAIDKRLPGSNADDDIITGTPRYMAPEQIQGGKPDRRSDLYALGVVLYRLLAGKLPFDADPIEQLIHQIISQNPPRLEPLHDKTPVELIELVNRLLAKQPEARYQDAALVLEELQEIRANMDRGLLKSARKTSSAWRWPLVLSLGLALVLGAGLIWVHHSQREAMTQATYGFGDALVSVIARETAESLLLEDATALGNLVADFSVNPQVTHLHVSDRDGWVLASTDPFMQGELAPDHPGLVINHGTGAVRLVALGDGHFEFQTPVRFQARRIGQIQLGIDGSQLESTARTTMWMLVIVLLVTVGVVGAGFGWLWRIQQRSLQRISWGLQRVARGQYDFRLDPGRQDPLATLYRRFNDMAVRLEERHGHEQHRRNHTQPMVQFRDEEEVAAGEDSTVELVRESGGGKVLSMTRPMNGPRPDKES